MVCLEQCSPQFVKSITTELVLLFEISLSTAGGYGSILPTYVNDMRFKEAEMESNKGMQGEESRVVPSKQLAGWPAL